MYYRSDIEYVYDGTLPGFLCCIYHAFKDREHPLAITSAESLQESFFARRDIETDTSLSNRVWSSFSKKFGRGASRMVLAAYLNQSHGRELAIFEFLKLAYRIGPSAFTARTYTEASRFLKLAQETENECHQYLGFVRFEQYNGALAAVIKPKHSPLPLMQPHFVDRYPQEHFLIYDETNRLALIYKPYDWRILKIDGFTLPELDRRESALQLLWAQYYKTIAIKPRENPKCRMTHMQKRYWPQLTELRRAPQLECEGDLSELKLSFPEAF